MSCSHRCAPKPYPTLLDGEPTEALAAAQAAVDAPAGLGTIACYATGVAHLATGTWSHPGKSGAQAGIVSDGGHRDKPHPPLLRTVASTHPCSAEAAVLIKRSAGGQ
ncbi:MULTISPECIES: hypothetical protein [Streptomyces]|uniref:hypothetical protein n=1 Tax=Streptomyces TaxID=1883 RepID=UPI0004C5EADA|nr:MULTISPECIES: hypothetical protein [Streptomyces]KOG59856.1 hypothetical protein ADK77_38530 [Streptomyces antibioticus]